MRLRVMTPRLRVEGHPLRREVFPFLKGVGHPPAAYIPATEVKGFLRTAVLYDAVNQNHPILQKLVERLRSLQPSPGPKPSRFAVQVQQVTNWLEAMVFRGGEENPAQYDAFKFLRLADSKPLPLEDAFYIGAAHGPPLRGGQRVQVLCELLRPRTEVVLPEGATPASRWLQEAEERHALHRRLHNKGFLKKCAYQFSKAILDAEGYGGSPLARRNTQERPLIRIGLHTGYFSKTMGLLLRPTSLLASVIAPLFVRTDGARLRFPVTRWNAYDASTGGLSPIGWLQIEEWEEDNESQRVQLLRGAPSGLGAKGSPRAS